MAEGASVTADTPGGSVGSRHSVPRHFINQAVQVILSWNEQTSGERTAAENRALDLLMQAQQQLGG